VRPSGKVNLIAVVILGALAYGIWWVITFSSVYLDNIDVKEAVDAGFNLSNRGDDVAILNAILAKTNASTLGIHDETDEFGVVTQVGGIGLKEENITVTRDEVLKKISITVEYQRKVFLKPSAKVKYVKFRVQKEGPIPPL
jgi:hypothetical protein